VSAAEAATSPEPDRPPSPAEGRRFELPVFRTLGRAYVATFGRSGAFLRLAWPWMLVCYVVVAAATGLALLAPYFTHRFAMLVSLAAGLVTVIGFAVAWHRFLLVDSPMPYFRFGGRHLAYMAHGIAIGLAWFLFLFLLAYFFLPFIVVYGGTFLIGFFLVLFLVTAILWSLGVVSRALLILPSVAIGPRRRVAETLVYSRFNGFRLLSGIVHAVFPFFAVAVGCVVVVYDSTAADLVAVLAVEAVAVVSLFLGLCVALSFLSFAYLASKRHHDAAADMTKEEK
jgi:hypothetical protein